MAGESEIVQSTWPQYLEAAIGIVGMIVGYAIFISKKNNLEDVEDRVVDMSEELFLLDQQVKGFEDAAYDFANSFPDHVECPVSVARVVADVERISSRQLNRVVTQAGKGQVGFRRAMIRRAGIATAQELGGRLGQANKHEILLKNASALQKIRPIVESSITGAYPNILPRSYENIGNAYASMMTFGATMFNGAYATLNYAIGDIITDRRRERFYRDQSRDDGLRQSGILDTPTEREVIQSPITLEQSETEKYVEDFYGDFDDG